MFKGAKILWRSSEDLRDLMISYYTEKGAIPVKPTGNWRILPPEARQSLEQQALQEGRQNSTK
jgi:2',3'-cyclic-nucleotide 2'-phosphodiesterase/3'-nucleotidase